MRAGWGALLCALAVAGCAGPEVTPSPTAPAASESPSRTPTAPPAQVSPVSVPTSPPAAALEEIRDDLGERGVTEMMTVVSADTVTWPDGSLGCPEFGIVYPTAMEDGLRIVVDAGGRTWDYRFDSAGKPRLCEPEASA